MGNRLDNATRLYLEGIRDGNFVEAINAYAGDRYTQHSTPVKDGKDGFIEFFEDFVKRYPERDIEIVRGFEDGRYVFLHALQTLDGGEYRYVTADIFDTDENRRMIEHWDIIEEWVEETVSGQSQVDGPTEPTDLHKTAVNKLLVTRFVEKVLIDGQFDKITDFVSTETYVEHSPRMTEDGFGAFARSHAEQGQPSAYEALHKLVGCGDFVATLSKVDVAGTGAAVIDLFRVSDDRIVEHWDVMEEIPPVDEWVNSGKF